MISVVQFRIVTFVFHGGEYDGDSSRILCQVVSLTNHLDDEGSKNL
jgi:hypothetical protein